MKFWSAAPMPPPYPTLRAAIVNLKRDSAVFRGVIFERRDGYLILRNAHLLRPRAESVPVDGEVLIPEADVEFIQLLPAGV